MTTSRVFVAWLIVALTSGAMTSGEPATNTGRAEIMVYAAASLRDALAEMAPSCEKAVGATLVFNFAGSLVLENSNSKR